MKANKWIEKDHKYIPYELPDVASLYEDDMDKEVACFWCGKKQDIGQLQLF